VTVYVALLPHVTSAVSHNKAMFASLILTCS